mgnify:CR=1 FL=1
MKSLKLSIIIPVFNVEKYVGACIESLYKQGISEDEFEVILINDGSTDNSLSVIQEYENQYSNITIISQKNQGLSATRNYGIKLAKGEYLLFVDSDDLIVDNTLKVMLHIAIQNQVDILKGDYVKANNQEIENGIEISNLNSYTPSVIKTGEQGFIEDYNPMYSYAVINFYRREFITKNKIYFLEGKYFEDVAYTIEAYLKAQTFMAIPLQFYVYRQNDSSIMATMSVNKLYSMNDIIAYNHQQKNKIPLSKKGMEKLNYSIYASMIVNLWYLSHHHSLYPHRMEVINDLKKKVPNLYFKGSLKQRFVSFCYTYIPDIYIRIRYMLATKKYK